MRIKERFDLFEVHRAAFFAARSEAGLASTRPRREKYLRTLLHEHSYHVKSYLIEFVVDLRSHG